MYFNEINREFFFRMNFRGFIHTDGEFWEEIFSRFTNFYENVERIRCGCVIKIVFNIYKKHDKMNLNEPVFKRTFKHSNVLLITYFS